MSDSNRQDEGKSTELGDGWIEKDGDVIKEELEETLPEARPTDGQAPLP